MIYCYLSSHRFPSLFPYHLSNKIIRTKYLITNLSQILYLIIINRNKYHPILRQQRTSHHEPWINHITPIRMEASTCFGVLEIFVSQFIHSATCLVILFRRHSKIIMIDKVVTRIIGRVDIDHLHLAHIRTLQQFQHFEVVTLDIQVLGSVPIHGVLHHRTECLVDGSSCFCLGGILAYPAKFVGLTAFVHRIIAQQLAQGIEVHYTLQLSRLRVAGLREAGGGYLIECIEVELHPIGGCQIQTFNLLVHVLYSIFVFNTFIVFTSVTGFYMPKTKIPQACQLAGREYIGL